MIDKIVECRVRINLYNQFLNDIQNKKGILSIKDKYEKYLSREKRKFSQLKEMFDEKYNKE